MIVVIQYTPLIKGGIIHTRELNITESQLQGIISLADSIGRDISLVKYPYTIPEIVGNRFTAKFNGNDISFDEFEVLQGAVQSCILFGVDPSTIITDIYYDGTSYPVKFEQYFGIISIPNSLGYTNGVVVGKNEIGQIIDPALSDSMFNVLNRCFPGVDPGVFIPSDAYFIATNSERTDVLTLCFINTDLPEDLIKYGPSHYITSVCSDPTVRGQGLSKSLLICALNNAINNGGNRFILEVLPTNVVAYNLYTSLGFLKVGTNVNYDVLSLSFD